MRIRILFCIVIFTFVFGACHKPEEWDAPVLNEWYSGGKQTVFETGSGAFSAMFPEISARNSFFHEKGDLSFEASFVSSGELNPGLGPIFNSVACTSCHINDGRGTPIGPGTQMISLLFRLSIPGSDPHGGPLGVPGYGGQLQQNAIFGVQPEAEVTISYTESPGQFADGDSYSLRVPTYTMTDWYTTAPANIMISPRIAPPVFGLGLLEAIDESTILEFADETDSDGDGISGKPNYVWNVLMNDHSLGRFGWKCGQPTVLQQSAGAYNEDMGITNFIFDRESAHDQVQYNGIPGTPEVTDSILYSVAHYISTLAVPARRDVNNENVLAGKNTFNALGCASCHRPMMQTGAHVEFPEVSSQFIFPYSDLLLHDMGDGLADYRPDNLASGYEWRTPPLWGIGLTQVVNGHNNFLHDGRARTLEEAILWHGGEAEPAKNKYVELSKLDRENLLQFLQSL